MNDATAQRPVFLRYWGGFIRREGQADIFLEYFRPLLARGWACYFVLGGLPENAACLQGLREAGVHVLAEPRPRSRYDARATLRVRRLCRELGVTVLVCDNIAIPPLLGAFLARVPVRIWNKRAMSTAFEEMRPPTFKERLAWSLRITCWLSTQVIAVSDMVKGELVEMGMPERKILVRSNPRIRRGGVEKLDRESCRRSFGCTGEEILMATLGHAVPVKGWDVLLQAFARVAARHPRARLVLAGSCEAPEERGFFSRLQSVIQTHPLSQTVRFTGHLADAAPLHRAADVFVLPSRSEGCANALIEALDAGLPCVATRVGNAAELITEGVNGFLVERGDADALANALLRTCDDALRAAMARRAKLPATVPSLAEYSAQLADDYEVLVRNCKCARAGLRWPWIRKAAA